MTSQPKVTKQVASLAGFVKDTVKLGQLRAEPEEATRRFAVCRECPELTTEMPSRLGVRDGVQRCKECGCSMGKKVQWAASKCPLGKW